MDCLYTVSREIRESALTSWRHRIQHESRQTVFAEELTWSHKFYVMAFLWCSWYWSMLIGKVRKKWDIQVWTEELMRLVSKQGKMEKICYY